MPYNKVVTNEEEKKIQFKEKTAQRIEADVTSLSEEPQSAVEKKEVEIVKLRPINLKDNSFTADPRQAKPDTSTMLAAKQHARLQKEKLAKQLTQSLSKTVEAPRPVEIVEIRETFKPGIAGDTGYTPTTPDVSTMKAAQVPAKPKRAVKPKSKPEPKPAEFVELRPTDPWDTRDLGEPTATLSPTAGSIPSSPAELSKREEFKTRLAKQIEKAKAQKVETPAPVEIVDLKDFNVWDSPIEDYQTSLPSRDPSADRVDADKRRFKNDILQRLSKTFERKTAEDRQAFDAIQETIVNAKIPEDYRQMKPEMLYHWLARNNNLTPEQASGLVYVLLQDNKVETKPLVVEESSNVVKIEVPEEFKNYTNPQKHYYLRHGGNLTPELANAFMSNSDGFEVIYVPMEVEQPEFHLQGEHEQKTHGGGGSRLGPGEQKVLDGISDPAVKARVGKMLHDRRAAEPHITELLSGVAEESGAELLGLAFKFKDAQGVVNKIDRKVQEKGINPDEAAESISDALRYTMASSPDNYVNDMTRTIKTLTDQGFEFEEVEQNFDDPPRDAYQGVNTVFRNSSGLRVELQFHTPETFDVKDRVIHRDYELFRDVKTPRSEKKAAFDRMVSAWQDVTVPPGISDIPPPDNIHGAPVKRVFRPFT